MHMDNKKFLAKSTAEMTEQELLDLKRYSFGILKKHSGEEVYERAVFTIWATGMTTLILRGFTSFFVARGLMEAPPILIFLNGVLGWLCIAIILIQILKCVILKLQVKIAMDDIDTIHEIEMSKKNKNPDLHSVDTPQKRNV